MIMREAPNHSPVHVPHDEAEYDALIEEIEALLDEDPARDTEAYSRLELLSVLAEAYEREHHPAEAYGATPQQVVDFMVEQKGMDRSELARIMGGRSRVSEFFSGKRSLSLGQVRALRGELGIPADLLISLEG
jgi:HTH-type transcriptional regulator/antitoxin HigA